MSTFNQLHDYINELYIIDTHEHLPLNMERDPHTDVLSEWLSCYFGSDLVSAGLPAEALQYALDSSVDISLRWASVEQYWNFARSTGYGRALSIAAKDLYDIEHIDKDSIALLNERFIQNNTVDRYRIKLGDKGKIAVSIRDVVPEPFVDTEDPFVYAFRTDYLTFPSAWGGSWENMCETGKTIGIELNTLTDWMEIARHSIEKSLHNDKVVCLKSAIAYQRPLRYTQVSENDAQSAFNALYLGDGRQSREETYRNELVLSSWMMHFTCQVANEYELTYQIHTGHQEGNEYLVEGTNPVWFSDMFRQYPKVKFNLFHLGYPFAEESGSLAKTFSNVYLDMCWSHVLCPELAERVLYEWIGSVPANKINAFGGDYFFPDGVYGHQKMARKNVASALSKKVERGEISMARAKELADWFFFENARRLYPLDPYLKKHGF